MDSKRLKAAYGKDVTFWGGGVDTQRVLPFGTPDEVRDEVKRRIDDFAPGGGFVFATVHNIQAFVPPANIEAAFDTALTYGGAPGRERDARPRQARHGRQQRILALTCEVLARSVYLCAARSPHVVDVRLNRRGLHDDPPNLRTILQAQVDEIGAPYDAVVLAYGLCGGATAGLRAGAIPLVVPRAHDCITLFLGSRSRYDAEFVGHPGTYWYVQDYLERTDDGSAFGGVGAGVRRGHAGDLRGVRREVRRGQRRLPHGGAGRLALPLRPGRLRGHGRGRIPMPPAWPRTVPATTPSAGAGSSTSWPVSSSSSASSSTATGPRRTCSSSRPASSWP